MAAWTPALPKVRRHRESLHTEDALGAELLHFKKPFWDNMIAYRTEGVHVFVLLNSTTKMNP